MAMPMHGNGKLSAVQFAEGHRAATEHIAQKLARLDLRRRDPHTPCLTHTRDPVHQRNVTMWTATCCCTEARGASRARGRVALVAVSS